MIIDTRMVREKLRQYEFNCPHELNLWNDFNEKIDDEFHPQLDKMIKWCKNNVRGRSMYCGDLLFRFQRKEDAMAFKLRWS